MNDSYRMDMTVTGFEKDKSRKIISAAKGEWAFDDINVDDNKPSIVCGGVDDLRIGEGEEEFAVRLAKAVFRANGKPCQVHIEAMDLEFDPPCEEYDFDENNQPDA